MCKKHEEATSLRRLEEETWLLRLQEANRWRLETEWREQIDRHNVLEKSQSLPLTLSIRHHIHFNKFQTGYGTFADFYLIEERQFMPKNFIPVQGKWRLGKLVNDRGLGISVKLNFELYPFLVQTEQYTYFFSIRVFFTLLYIKA